MGRFTKLMQRILTGSADENIAFSDLCLLLVRLDFEHRIKGGHHIFSRGDVDEIINLQPRGSKAKPYQVKQVRTMLVKYRMGERDVDPV